MTDLERAHLTELICLARARGVADTEIAAALREAADLLDKLAPDPKQQEATHG